MADQGIDVPVVIDEESLSRLPSNHVLRLSLNEKEFFIVGTAHVRRRTV